MDAECGYRYARSIAADYGGDLEAPMTMVGFSLGASFSLVGGLTENTSVFGPANDCFAEVPRADAIVAVSGCYYEYDGQQFNFDMSTFANTDARVVLAVGDQDDICAPWQSQDAAAEMIAAGYDVDLVLLEGANHFAPIFHDLIDDDWVVVPDDPAGRRVVELTVDVIAAA